MNTVQALKREIDDTPETILRETYDFLVFLKGRARSAEKPSLVLTTPATRGNWPDFLVRQKAVFGARTVPDSQPILDEQRADRY
jgi:hypothetical protein